MVHWQNVVSTSSINSHDLFINDNDSSKLCPKAYHFVNKVSYPFLRLVKAFSLMCSKCFQF